VGGEGGVMAERGEGGADRLVALGKGRAARAGLWGWYSQAGGGGREVIG